MDISILQDLENSAPFQGLLNLFNDDTSEAVDATLYRQIIASLMLLTNTRLDICFAVNTLSQYMVNPKHIHLVGAKYVINKKTRFLML